MLKNSVRLGRSRCGFSLFRALSRWQDLVLAGSIQETGNVKPRTSLAALLNRDRLHLLERGQALQDFLEPVLNQGGHPLFDR